MSYQQQNLSQSNYYNSQYSNLSNNQMQELYSTHSDPYNYPPMNRKDLMNLQTIQPYENGFYHIKNETVRDYNLNTKDIRGAQPKFKIQDLNKPDLFNVKDIDGAVPRPHIQFTQYNKASHILDHDDIKGSHPNINKFYTKREPFNPLEPQYKLQEAQQIITDPPKFLRDTLFIDDIEGTRAKKQILAYDKNLPEIEGAQTKKKFLPKDYIDSLNVRDINNKKQLELSRCVNPLNPTYKWQYEEDNLQSQAIGAVDGSYSRQLHKEMKYPFDKYSSTDIQGAQAGSLIKKYNMNHRYAYSNQDIEGTQPGTKKLGIQTNRCLNPLRPDYQFLGRSEGDNAYGGFQFENQKNQNQNYPRSQLAASASQNLIRTNQNVIPQMQQQLPLSQSQSVSQINHRENNQQVDYQLQQNQVPQMYYQSQNNNQQGVQSNNFQQNQNYNFQGNHLNNLQNQQAQQGFNGQYYK
ncbi:hypothetical protein ABPG72_002260 [Tetrahymena utriculariae]